MIVVIISFFLELWLDDRCRKTGMSKDTFFASFFFRDYRASHEWKEEEKGIEECVMSLVNPGIPPTQGDRPDRSFN